MRYAKGNFRKATPPYMAQKASVRPFTIGQHWLTITAHDHTSQAANQGNAQRSSSCSATSSEPFVSRSHPDVQAHLGAVPQCCRKQERKGGGGQRMRGGSQKIWILALPPPPIPSQSLVFYLNSWDLDEYSSPCSCKACTDESRLRRSGPGEFSPFLSFLVLSWMLLYCCGGSRANTSRRILSQSLKTWSALEKRGKSPILPPFLVPPFPGGVPRVAYELYIISIDNRLVPELCLASSLG